MYTHSGLIITKILTKAQLCFNKVTICFRKWIIKQSNRTLMPKIRFSFAEVSLTN